MADSNELFSQIYQQKLAEQVHQGEFKNKIPKPNFLRGGEFCITSSYGDARSYNDILGFHNGIDIANKLGDLDTIITAPHDGIVTIRIVNGGECRVGERTIYYNGSLALELYNDTFKTVYLHTGSIKVANGSLVKQGQPIAKIGSNGCSIGNHLHYEIYKGSGDFNYRIENPDQYVSYKRC
ncbi:M23 family metallopeptidase [candidate division WWE3 bacterium]|uniref:M23 family metallopeptidase n=1 Tax=candidate division WWE3 bacterium TaxID=2053526 RepID=A0A955ECZ8_UNCKA|nr:M23 family metallopeptidase [candidate division WWE3 bacterium]